MAEKINQYIALSITDKFKIIDTGNGNPCIEVPYTPSQKMNLPPGASLRYGYEENELISNSSSLPEGTRVFKFAGPVINHKSPTNALTEVANSKWIGKIACEVGMPMLVKRDDKDGRREELMVVVDNKENPHQPRGWKHRELVSFDQVDDPHAKRIKLNSPNITAYPAYIDFTNVHEATPVKTTILKTISNYLQKIVRQ
ncbi:MAG: hypothetical protein WC069_05535 [Candidatus Shapirobacteria bacterium]